MKLIPLPAFDNNYIWMLHNGREAVVVDPGDAKPVLHALQSEDVQLKAILVTHHHHDHTGGVDYLRQTTGAQVFGPAHEPVPEPLKRLIGGDVVCVLGLEFRVIDVPGHTAGHIAYFCDSQERLGGNPVLFCGDTLFSGGCGRLFEGTPAQMLASLAQLSALPDSSRVCCAHEYTLGNLQFALEIEPDNPQLVAHHKHCLALRANGQPTLPSTIALENQINPFLRSHHPTVMESARTFDAKGVDQAGVFATLRQWKNHYR